MEVVEDSETETFGDAVNDANVNGTATTDEGKIVSSENESEFKEDMNCEHAAELEETGDLDRNCRGAMNKNVCLVFGVDVVY